MADNRVMSGAGFRWFTGNQFGSRPLPVPVPRFVASGATFNVTSGATNVGLGPGDVVKEVSDGSVTLCEGAETTPGVPYGVVVGVKEYWDGSKMTFGNVLPSGITYGTVLSRRSWVLVVPIHSATWEVDVDDATSATTEAAYHAFIGENVSFINTGVAGATRASPKLDISTHATTNTLAFRIVNVSPSQHNQDFSGANVKLLVEANVVTAPAFSATGV